MDEIDDLLKNEEERSNYKECFECNTKHIQVSKIKCPNCKTNLKESRLKAEKGKTKDKKEKLKRKQSNETSHKVYIRRLILCLENLPTCLSEFSHSMLNEFSQLIVYHIDSFSLKIYLRTLRNKFHDFHPITIQ